MQVGEFTKQPKINHNKYETKGTDGLRIDAGGEVATVTAEHNVFAYSTSEGSAVYITIPELSKKHQINQRSNATPTTAQVQTGNIGTEPGTGEGDNRRSVNVELTKTSRAAAVIECTQSSRNNISEPEWSNDPTLTLTQTEIGQNCANNSDKEESEANANSVGIRTVTSADAAHQKLHNGFKRRSSSAIATRSRKRRVVPSEHAERSEEFDPALGHENREEYIHSTEEGKRGFTGRSGGAVVMSQSVRLDVGRALQRVI